MVEWDWMVCGHLSHVSKVCWRTQDEIKKNSKIFAFHIFNYFCHNKKTNSSCRRWKTDGILVYLATVFTTLRNPMLASVVYTAQIQTLFLLSYSAPCVFQLLFCVMFNKWLKNPFTEFLKYVWCRTKRVLTSWWETSIFKALITEGRKIYLWTSLNQIPH